MDRVPDMNEFADAIKKIQKIEEKSREIKPYKRPNKDYFECLAHFILTRQAQLAKMNAQENKYQITQTHITVRRHSCLKANIQELKPILLRDMFVNKIHHGKYLECRIVEAPFTIQAVHCLIVDNDGQLERLSLYNCFTEEQLKNLPEFLPIGTHLIIKEPYLKLLASGNNEFNIRCDSPTDIIVKYWS